MFDSISNIYVTAVPVTQEVVASARFLQPRPCPWKEQGADRSFTIPPSLHGELVCVNEHYEAKMEKVIVNANLSSLEGGQDKNC